MNELYCICISVNINTNNTNLIVCNNKKKIIKKNYVCHVEIPNLKKCIALNIEREAGNKTKGIKNNTKLQKRLDVLLPILKKYNVPIIP